MREALAFLILILLISLGWNQPFSEHVSNLTGQPVVSRVPAYANQPGQPGAVASAGRPGAHVSPPRDNSWMWAPTTMDKPYNQSRSSGR